MEKKIELTEQELQAVQAYLDGTLDEHAAPNEQQAAIMNVTDKADALCEELDAYDELDGDLIAWFWNKYQQQEHGDE